MMNEKTSKKKIIKIDAGEFSAWLNDFINAMEGNISANVPCGKCVACCTSSKFVHIRPSDKKALNIIPKELLFSAPGLPKGYFLLGYDENGHCPMFKDSKCSIYESRPETCRQYDCRVYAATSIPIEKESHAIAQQAKRWEFSLTTIKDKEKYQLVQNASKFLLFNRNCFPVSYLPLLNSQLAIFAIRIHGEFRKINNDSSDTNLNEFVSNIVTKYQNR
jgi:Fe-S-cluster containining protein